jgi:polysaccharide biosynthesis transport protein
MERNHETPDGRTFREVFDLREWARVFSAHVWWIVIVTSAVIVGTAMTTFTATNYYRATQRVLIERDSNTVLDVDRTYETGGESNDYFLTQYKLLESRAVAEAALALLPTADREWFARRGNAIDEFMQLRRIVPIRKSRLVDILTEHPEPKIAELMARAVMQAYVQNNENRRKRSSTMATRNLRDDERDLKTKLLEARRVAQEYKARHGIVDLSDSQSLAEYRLKSLNNELAGIERDLSDSDSRLSTAQGAMLDANFTTDVPEALQNRVVAEIKLAYMDSSSKLSQLARKYKPKHPRVLEQQSKVDSIAKQIRREVKAVFGSLQHENDRLRRHMTDVESRIVKQNKALNEENSRHVRYQYLADEAESTRELYDSVASRLKEVEVIADYTTSNVHAVGGTSISDGPVRPRRFAAIGIALLAGLVLSFALAFVLDAMDNSIKSGAEAERLLRVPVLGMVPRVRGVHTQQATDDKALDPESNIAEAFRSIRTSLLLSAETGDLESLVVTSTAAGEGKSLVAMNIAASFARAGHRVLLVDAEMRRPRLHNALDVHSLEGFSSVLIGDRSVDQVAFETEEDNLYFMPCGVLPPNPLELLTIGMTKRLRRDLSEFFDLVVFDSPPVGIVSDACVLASAADHVMFVVRTFAADRIRSRRAIQNLKKAGASIVGLVVNHADSKSERGRQLDFTYDANYASLPASTIHAPRSGDASTHAIEKDIQHIESLIHDLDPNLEQTLSDVHHSDSRGTSEEE